MVTKGDGPCQNHSKRYASRPLPILLTCAPSPLLCAERCQQPQWDSHLQFSPKQSFYWVGEEVTLSCFTNNTPPLSVIRCANRSFESWNGAWEVKNISGTWHRLAEDLTCTTGKLGTSRSPLLHALLAVDRTWTCCCICETPWAQLRVRSQLGAVSTMERVRSLQCGTGFLCPCISSRSIPELYVMGKLEWDRSCPSIHLSPSGLYHLLAQAHALFLLLGALGFLHCVEC